jgi:hypothetical protein
MDALIALLKADANAANAFGAIASVAAAFLALLVSAISVGISVWAVTSQRKHNELSVRPLAEITVADYENSLRVKLRNHGIGPMIVTAVTVSDGVNAKPTFFAWMPDLPRGRLWTNFADEVRDRTMAPGRELVLLELTEYEGEVGFEQCREVVRAALKSLTVNVEYTDVYGNVMTPRRKELSWFGRHNAI